MVGYPVNFDYEPFFLIMLAGTVTAVCGFRYGVGVGVAVALTLFFLDRAHIFGGSVIWIAALVVSVLGSAAVRNQAAVTAELPAAQADLAARAAAEERHRLARDIHDLIAHSLAVTMLHLTGARLALKDGDTGEAEEALDEAERTGRQAMGEIRRTVGLLGPGDFGSSAAPTPKAVDLPGLIGDFRAAGLQVDLDVTGNLESIPLTPGLALYRIVQESLSNVVKHAPGQTVHLGVETTDGVLRVAVSNPLPVAIGAGDSPEFDKTIDGANALAGDGVRGMTERAQLLEGRLRAGPQAGSWVVDAKIPLEVLSS
jgi:signal transduction histidine kinase